MIYLLLIGLGLFAVAAVMAWREINHLHKAQEVLLYTYSKSPTHYQEIIHTCNDAISVNPRGYFWYIQRGSAYRNLKDYEHAIKDFNKAITLKRRNAEAYHSRALVQGDLQNYQQAIDDLNKAIALRTNYVAAYINRAIVYSKLGNYQQAIQDYDRAIELGSSSVKAYLNRGLTYHKLEDNERALQDYKQALMLDSDHLPAYLAIGAIYFQKRNYYPALVAYQRAVELQVDNAGVYYICGVIYYLLKEYDQAVEHSDQTLVFKPDDANTYHLRGAAYLGLGNVQQALVDLVKSQELEPASASHGWMVAWTKMIDTRPDVQMAQWLEQIAERDRASAMAYVCKGVACWIRGNYDEALAAFEQSIAKRSEQEDAYFWQGMTYASLGRDEEARAAIERALQEPFPPLLLSPLRWFAQDRPEFYASYAAPLLQSLLP